MKTKFIVTTESTILLDLDHYESIDEMQKHASFEALKIENCICNFYESPANKSKPIVSTSKIEMQSLALRTELKINEFNNK